MFIGEDILDKMSKGPEISTVKGVVVLLRSEGNQSIINFFERSKFTEIRRALLKFRYEANVSKLAEGRLLCRNRMI
jgi:hypothetical protein